MQNALGSKQSNINNSNRNNYNLNDALTILHIIWDNIYALNGFTSTFCQS